MKKIYRVQVPYSGYSRGYVTYEVEAESEEEAVKDAGYGREVFDNIVRDDRDFEWDDAEVEG